MSIKTLVSEYFYYKTDLLWHTPLNIKIHKSNLNSIVPITKHRINSLVSILILIKTPRSMGYYLLSMYKSYSFSIGYLDINS